MNTSTEAAMTRHHAQIPPPAPLEFQFDCPEIDDDPTLLDLPERSLVFELDWYVAEIHVGREIRARKWVRDAGAEPWLPLNLIRVRQHRGKGAGRHVERLVPRYPGYLFVGIEPGFDLPSLGSRANVAGVMGWMPEYSAAGDRSPARIRAAGALDRLWELLWRDGGAIDLRPPLPVQRKTRGETLSSLATLDRDIGMVAAVSEIRRRRGEGFSDR